MKILIVEPEPLVSRITTRELHALGHEACTAEDSAGAWRVLRAESIDGMLLDENLGKAAGLDLLRDMKAQGLLTPVIVFAADATIARAVDAMRHGACDYFARPFLLENVTAVLAAFDRVGRSGPLETDLEAHAAAAVPGRLLLSAEPAVVKAYTTAFRAAATDATILILGPSGTGKTVLARAIHDRSQRSAEPFVTINCACLSPALLESELFGHVRGSFTGAIRNTTGKVAAADGGTLFFDEIGETPVGIQAKLLRLLDDRSYERVGETRAHRAEVRVICATNGDLPAAVASGRFRADLYHRIKVVTLVMPPLVDRPDDLRPLVDNFLRLFGAASGRPLRALSAAAYAALDGYAWPGNLRELRNVIERAVILATGDTITPEDFPEEIRLSEEPSMRPGHRVTLEALEEEHIRRVLAAVQNYERAAVILGIDTATLYRKRRRLQIA